MGCFSPAPSLPGRRFHQPGTGRQPSRLLGLERRPGSYYHGHRQQPQWLQWDVRTWGHPARHRWSFLGAGFWSRGQLHRREHQFRGPFEPGCQRIHHRSVDQPHPLKPAEHDPDRGLWRWFEWLRLRDSRWRRIGFHLVFPARLLHNDADTAAEPVVLRGGRPGCEQRRQLLRERSRLWRPWPEHCRPKPRRRTSPSGTSHPDLVTPTRSSPGAWRGSLFTTRHSPQLRFRLSTMRRSSPNPLPSC